MKHIKCESLSKGKKKKENGVFLFGISFFDLEISTLLCNSNEESVDVIGGFFKPVQHSTKRLQMEPGYLVFHKKRLKPRVHPWKQHIGHYSVSFVMYISCAKFEEHCCNISGDIQFLIQYFII